MGTGIVTGSGGFAMGKVAGAAGRWFPLAFLVAVAAAVASITSPSYVKFSKTCPSAGALVAAIVVDAIVFAEFFVHRIRTDWVVTPSFVAVAALVAGGETLGMRRYSDAGETTDRGHLEATS